MALIWIDIANAPNAPLFAAMCSILEADGHSVVLTVRDFVDTVTTAKRFGLHAHVIGESHGTSRDERRKRPQFLERLRQLETFARRLPIALALGHGSATQAIVARDLGIPCISATDYEFVRLDAYANVCGFLVPAVVPTEAWQGVPRPALQPFVGLKEDAYMRPNGDEGRTQTRRVLGVGPDERLVVFRPVSDSAHYMEKDYADLDEAVLEEVAKLPKTRILVAPRSRHQAERLQIAKSFGAHVRLLDEVVDGRALVFASDLVVSGGGTMVREAASLGIAAVSYFPGRWGAVDKWLHAHGRIQRVDKPQDVARIVFSSQTPPTIQGRSWLVTAQECIRQILGP